MSNLKSGAMKAFFSKSLLKTQTGNNDIAKNDLCAAYKRDYYCEGQEPRAEMPEERTMVRSDNAASVKTKKQKFFACYNMFF